jgi:hypothetical protein
MFSPLSPPPAPGSLLAKREGAVAAIAGSLLAKRAGAAAGIPPSRGEPHFWHVVLLSSLGQPQFLHLFVIAMSLFLENFLYAQNIAQR